MTEVYDLYDEYIYLNGHWERIGGGGSNVPIDDHLSNISENPVQNKVITLALNGLATRSDLNDAIEAQASINAQLLELLGHAGIIDDGQITTISTFSSSKMVDVIQETVDAAVGDINSLIDAINGEVI